MKKIYWVVIALLGLHLLILSQLQFTAWPEMVSFPYLINHGFITYKDMVHAYPPLLVNTLAVLFRIFGYKLIVLKTFGWTTILISDLLVFLIIQNLTKKQILALLGLLVYVILQPVLEGNMVWPDLFIVPFLLLMFLFLIKKKYFFAGIAIGLAILTKQTGVFFLGLGGIYILFQERKVKYLINYILGISLLILPFLFTLFYQNSFQEFWKWTILYPGKYWTKFPGYVQLSLSLRQNLSLLILFLPLIYLIFKSKRKVFRDKYFLLSFGFLVCGIIGIYPRFSFFHFQSALAFLVILYLYLLQNCNKKILYLFVATPFFILIINFKSFQFGKPRFWTGSDINLAENIQSETPSNQPIYLLGLNSNLYAFSNRLPNIPWLDNFGWYLEIEGVQRNVLNSFKNNPPSTIFWVTPGRGNWYDIGVYQPKIITEYIVNNYTKTKEIQKGIWEWKRK